MVRTYAEPNIKELVRSLPGGDVFARSKKTLLIVPGPNGESVPISDPNTIGSKLDGILAALRAAVLPFIPIAFIFGALVGTLLSPTSLVATALATTALTAVAYKATHACPVCPVDKVFGVPVEFWGLGSYFALTCWLLARPLDRRTASGTALLAAAALSVQLFLFWEARATCWPCVVAALANGALLSNACARLRVGTWQAPKLPLRLLIPMTGFCVFFILQLFVEQRFNLAGTTQSSQDSLALRGKHLRDLQITAGRKKEIIAVLSDSCGACQMARAWFATHPTIPIRIFRWMGSGDHPQSQTDLPSSVPIPGVPEVLLADQGVIVSESRGWSNDPVWELSKEQQFKKFLEKQDASRKEKT